MPCSCDGRPCVLATTIQASEQVLCNLVMLVKGERQDTDGADFGEVVDTAITVLHQMAREAETCREHASLLAAR